MRFLMHLGSSTIQYALCKKNKVVKYDSVLINNVNEDLIITFIQTNIKKIEELYFCSVNNIFDELLEKISKIVGLQWIEIKNKDVPHMQSIPDTVVNLGIDVLINLWYASCSYDEVILIDFGQLTKIYQMQAKTIYGGVLTPSVHLQLRSIIQNVPRVLTFVKEDFNKQLVGVNNNQSLTIGLFYNQISFVNNLVKHYCRNKIKYKIIITGGAFKSKDLIEPLNFNYEYYPDYLMQGFAHLLTHLR